jgi:hypothetical protein
MKLEISQGYIEGYICDSCNGYNDILQRHCIYCNSYRDREVNQDGFERSAILRRGILLYYDVGESTTMDNDKRVELHSKFYTKANELISNMSYEQQVAWEEELEMIVIEAKASIQASSQKRREKQASMTKEERDRLITNPDMSVSEGLLAPKVRKDRQSKADQLVAGMAGMGISPEMINQLMSGITPGKTIASETKKKDFVFNAEEKEKANTNGATRQEDLLNEILSMADLNSVDIAKLQEKLNTAVLILPKTESKSMPEKMVKLVARIEELKAKESEPKSTSGFDPSSLF